MYRKEFIEKCDSSLKAVRTEFDLSQEKMAYIIGVSKKTLVEIEKGRSSLGFTGSVALCSIFRHSRELVLCFGEDIFDIIGRTAFSDLPAEQKIGSVLWQKVLQNDKYLIQQHIVTQHYRLFGKSGEKIMSSVDLNDLLSIFNSEN